MYGGAEFTVNVRDESRGGGVHAAAECRHGGGEQAGDDQSQYARRELGADIPRQDGVAVADSHAQLRRIVAVEGPQRRAHQKEEDGGRNGQRR